MEWTPGGSSQDIEDRRDQSGGGGGGGFGFGGLGIGGIIIVGLLSLVFRTNLFTLFEGGNTAPTQQVRTVPDTQRDAREEPQVEFVKFVLNDVQGTWDRLLLDQANRPYRHAKLVLFRDRTMSSCGTAREAIGPFYCPNDEKVYLDLGFFDELKNRFGAPGEFAQAYVIAHEIGHHVQKILGIEPKVHSLQEQNPNQANALSVRLELQADCFAGVWAHSTTQRKIIDESDVRSGLGAAAAVGDDRLQREAARSVSPESFTHGTSAQRTGWFQRGYDNGNINACNTFQRE